MLVLESLCFWFYGHCSGIAGDKGEVSLNLTPFLGKEDKGSGMDLQSVLGQHVSLVESVAIQTLKRELFQANFASFTFIFIFSFYDSRNSDFESCLLVGVIFFKWYL